MKRLVVLSPVILALAAPLHGACGGDVTPEAPRVSIVTNLSFPRALLDRATTLSLSVYEGEVTCDETTSLAALPTDATKARTLVERELAKTGCAPGVRFCGDVTVETSSTPRVFVATAKDATSTLAVGCTTAKVEQNVSLRIRMVRYLAKAVCGDGIVQPTEQCEPGGTLLCDDECKSKELLLSTGAPGNNTQTGDPGDKTDPFALWPVDSGQNGRFIAFYTDRAVTGGADIGLRVMNDDLTPVTTPPALAAGSILLPNGPTFPSLPASREQSRPSAVFLAGRYYVAFDDDNSSAQNGLDIHLRSMDTSFVADQAATPLGINGAGGAGEPNAQAAPALAAGPKNRLFVAWEDQAQGKIWGRTLTPPSTLGNQNEVSTTTGNSAVSVAATPTGWVAAWQSGTGIRYRTINEDGTPQGGDDQLSAGGGSAEKPRVAALSDGRFAIAFSSGGDVFVQRFDAKGVRVEGDLAGPVNDRITEGVQGSVAIATTTVAGGSFVVVWHDGSTNHIRGRMLGGSSGFLFNPVDGQASEFQASRTDGRVRANPTVAVGGAGPFVGIAWEDKTAGGAGVVARRFPLPTE